MMLIRKPSVLDTAKAVFLITDDPKTQDNLLTSWIVSNRDDKNFISLVAVEKKKVYGFLTGCVFPDKSAQITLINASSEEVLSELLKAFLKASEAETCILNMVNSPRIFEAFGFKVVSYNLLRMPQSEVIEDKSYETEVSIDAPEGTE